MSASEIDTALLEQAVARLPGDPLAPARREALALFSATGFPTTRHEDWRYTDLRPAIDISNLWLRKSATGAVADVPQAAVQRARELVARIDAHWILVVNGEVEQDSLASLKELRLPGIEVSSAPVEPLAVMRTDQPLTRFNAALLRDVLRISVDAGGSLDKPLGLLMLDDASAGSNVSQARVMLDIGERARAEFIEYHVSTGSHGQFANVVTELALGASAAVEYVRVQSRQSSHCQVGRLVARMGRDSRLRHAAFDFGGALIRNDLEVDIAEPGADVHLHGLYLASGNQHIDNHTRVDHRVGPASSQEEYRGILGDRSRCVFNGKAIVHKGADGTDARQANHNLLLSEKAEIDTKPELEIYADDVKCSHGATVGQLDKTALFYLRSRGLDADEAAKVLTRAFAAAIVAKAPVPSMRAHIDGLINDRLQVLVGGSQA